MVVWVQLIVWLFLGAFCDGVRDGMIWHTMRTGAHHPLYRHWHGVKFVSLTCYVLAGVKLSEGFGWTWKGFWVLAFAALASAPILRRAMRWTNFGKLYPPQDQSGLTFWFGRDRDIPFASRGVSVAFDWIRLVVGVAGSLWSAL